MTRGGSNRPLWLCFSLLLLAACVTTAAVQADDGKLPLSLPVKSLATPSDDNDSTPRQAMPGRPARPEPTTPGGKLPQYQLDRRHLALPTPQQRGNPRLRLILVLPDEPILVEASITIDGQPFRMPREQRIERILRQIESGENAASAEPSIEDGNRDTLTDRIRRYRQAGEKPLAADELRWLLTNWIDGPTLLLLNDNFQRFRANQRPAFEVLDANRDGTVDASELKRAIEAFRECDANRNDIVEYTELAEAASDPRRNKAEPTRQGKLMFLLPDESGASDLYRPLALRYAAGESEGIVPRWDVDSNGRFDGDELAALAEMAPDISVAVALDTVSPAASRITCTAVSERFAENVPRVRVEGDAITLPLASAEVAFSAVQAAGSDQVSLGAVMDGYPLLPRIDPNEDGRFTLRELRELPQRLRVIDRNQDGRLTADEAQPTIRVCFGLGPHVHRELAGIRTSQPVKNQPVVAGPEWFVRMDRNQDQDLTRGEFPGTDEQFADLDADGDELVSADEALQFDAKSKENEAKEPALPAAPHH